MSDLHDAGTMIFIIRVLKCVLLSLAFAARLSFGGEDKPIVSEATQRVALTAGQARAIALLCQSRPEKPAPLFLFTDPNKDPDDLSVLVETRSLQQQGFVDLRCAVTTLGNREVRTIRAKFTRSVLDDLGLHSAQVGVGVDYEFEVKDGSGAVDVKGTAGREKDHRVFVETPLLRPLAVVEPDGLALLKRELDRVADRSAVLVVNAGMVDLAELLRSDPELVQRKVARIVIMGGVEPRLDPRGFAIADKRAYNNSTHQPSADYVYFRVQELGLPLVIVNKEATYSAAAPRSFYDGIAATGHPVGVYLKEQQKQSLKLLWEGIHQGHLPPALTPAWFFRTFTDVDLDTPAGKTALTQATSHAENFEEIWSHVSKFNLYDPLALLAATPGAAELLFESEAPAGAKSRVRIIGKDSIKDATLMKDLLAALGIESLNPALPRN